MTKDKKMGIELVVEDIYNDCLGKNCARLSLYQLVYSCHYKLDEYCSRRMEYKGDNKILREHGPFYCEPYWGRSSKHELLPKVDGDKK